MTLCITPGELGLSELYQAIYEQDKPIEFKLDKTKIELSKQVVDKICQDPSKIVYGINTGFGKLHDQHISSDNLHKLQENLILSHATGVGVPLPNHIVRAILLLKINALAQGHSGVRYELIHILNQFVQNHAYPHVPSQGSVGASGDLAPLSHLVLPLLGQGKVNVQGKEMLAAQALVKLNIEKQIFEAKEGLALINGTQATLAILLDSYFNTVKIFDATLQACALTMAGVKARKQFLDSRIHALRRLPGQIEVARTLTSLLDGTDWQAHNGKVQDPYSIRCVPQVLGACKQQLDYIADILANEINAVTDNPLVFSDSQEILSGGNFHAEPLAFASDALANVLAEIGNIAERRVAMLMDPSFSGLPAFLTNNSGINSGFMNMHVTASSLASENKALAFPRSVDTIPTSMNQEDHVSMATNAALRLQDICANTQNIVAIELIAAAQAIRFDKNMIINGNLQKAYAAVTETVPFFEEDGYFSPFIEQISHKINNNIFMFSDYLGCTIKERTIKKS